MNLSRVQCSLVLSNEIANVASALRQSGIRDQEVLPENGEEVMEDALLEDFFSLQQKVLYSRHWEVVDPWEYVAPFLDAIRSGRVSASITTTALASIWKLLTSNVITASHQNSADTLRHIVSSLQTCKIEETTNDAYEAVVTRLVQVFSACVCADVGVLLSCDDVILIAMNLWSWCEIGPTTKDAQLKPSSIFIQTVRYSLEQLISCLFSRLRSCRVYSADGTPYPEFSDRVNEIPLSKTGLFANGSVQFEDLHNMVLTLSCGIKPFQHILLCCTEKMSMDSDDKSSSDLILFALQMLHVAIVHAGETIAEYDALLSIIRCDVFPALTVCLQRQSQRIHASVFQVVFAMYKLFGDELLLQIECFFRTSILRLCEGRNCPSQEHQEIALEALLDFCGYPGFLRDMYLNLDCRIERSNLFEDICALLSKTAFPVKSHLISVHMISMEGLLAMLLTLSAECGGDGAAANQLPEPEAELTEYLDIWSDLFEGLPPKFESVLDSELFQICRNYEEKQVLLARFEKSLKRKVTIAVDHFNRDYKKGFEYLQSMRLIPEENDAMILAKFLRVCPHLNSHTIGEILETFDFSQKSIEAALRMYFDAFKVPGEAQKIDRVVSIFSKVYFSNQVNNVFKNEDAVHVLAYSIIMLNTDLHKPEIKVKMTLEQFIRNNRGINDKEDFPREMLEQIYASIRDQPMRIGDGTGAEVSSVQWLNLNQMSKTIRGRKETPLKMATALDRDMFTLVWGPSVAAISVILDQVEESTTVSTTLTGLKLAAKIAFFYGVDEVIDNLVVNLFKATNILTPGIPKALVYFGMKEKAQLATEGAFFIANRYTSSLGSAGWRSVMDCVIRLNQLGILPEKFWEDTDAESDNISEPSFEMGTSLSGGGGGGGSSSLSATLWPWATRDNSLTEDEAKAQQEALACIQRCDIRIVFKDTKFLKLESLLELIRAVSWASVADEKTGLICLKLLFYITLRNRDRIKSIWPEIETHLESVLSGEQLSYSILECAVFGILRVCQRSLTKPGLSGTMLRILQMVPNIGMDHIRQMAETLAYDILTLIKLAVPFIEEGWAWDAICLLLQKTATSNQAFTCGMDTLTILARDGEYITPENFLAILETFKYYKGQAYPETIVIIVDMIQDMVKNVVNWPESSMHLDQDHTDEDEESVMPERTRMWYAVLRTLKEIAFESDSQVRNHTVLAFHHCVILGESLNVAAEIWGMVFYKELLDSIQFFLKKQGHREYEDVDKSLRSVVKTTTRTFLQLLHQIKGLTEFPDIWMKMLNLLQQTYAVRSDELTEAIPEEVKNLLLVMNKEDILHKDWKDRNGNNVWDLSWRKAKEISFSLTPEVLL
eukprot:g7224.t1